MRFLLAFLFTLSTLTCYAMTFFSGGAGLSGSFSNKHNAQPATKQAGNFASWFFKRLMIKILTPLI